MGLVTIDGHVENAKRFFQGTGKYYIGIANDNPKATEGGFEESEDTRELQGLIGLKRVDRLSLAYLLPEGESRPNAIKHGGREYMLSTFEDAYDNDARYVFVSAKIKSDDFEFGSYAQVGLLSNPVFKQGVTGDAISTQNITSQGVLNVYENRDAVDKQPGVSFVEQLMIEF